MSGSNTETETETESGFPDQHPECVFDVDDLDIPDGARYLYDLGEGEWECSRPVWEEASGNRCVWHTSDGQNQQKPDAELKKTVGDGDLHGSAATGEISVKSIFQWRRVSSTPTCLRRTSGMPTCLRHTSEKPTCLGRSSLLPTCLRRPSRVPTSLGRTSERLSSQILLRIRQRQSGRPV